MDGLLAAFGLSFGPALIYAFIVYQLDRFEKEPKRLIVGVFAWGAIVAVIGAIIAQLIFGAGVTIITGSKELANFSMTTIAAPLTEEFLKGMALLIVFALFHREFDSLMDGIVYAGIVALGFAATENFLYLLGAGFFEKGWSGLFTLFFLRVILSAWDHPLFTAFIGIGFAITRTTRNSLIKFTAPVIGYVVAVAAHSLNNTLIVVFEGAGFLATLCLNWSGWLIMFGLIVWANRRERHWIQVELKDEVERGTLTAAQFKTALSVIARLGAHWGSLGSKQFGPTGRFYQLCGELAQKKHQFEKHGDEHGNAAIIEKLRAELTALSPLART